MRFFKAQKYFDYGGIKNKLKKSYTHAHWVEDIWIDCRIEEDIRRLDYCCLILEQIENQNIIDIPQDLGDDRVFLDPAYENNKVVDSPLPLIQWSQKENTLIRTRFQSILANTNVWLTQKVIQYKYFQTGSEDDTTWLVGKTSKLRTKNRQDTIVPKAPKFKFIFGKGKDKIQGESSTQDTQTQDEDEEELLEEEIEHEGEELEKEQEEEYDEEGLLEISSTSQSKGMQEITPPSSHDIKGTIPPSILISTLAPFGSTFSYTSKVPSVVIHTIPSTTTSESTLDTPHDNIENVFLPNLSKVSSFMLDDFDKFMSEIEIPSKVSNLENPPAIVSSTHTIVTTIVQNQELVSQVLDTQVEDDTPLAPWLVFNAPKKEKENHLPK